MTYREAIVREFTCDGKDCGAIDQGRTVWDMPRGWVRITVARNKNDVRSVHLCPTCITTTAVRDIEKAA